MIYFFSFADPTILQGPDSPTNLAQMSAVHADSRVLSDAMLEKQDEIVTAGIREELK